jgi:hypothetical protein
MNNIRYIRGSKSLERSTEDEKAEGRIALNSFLHSEIVFRIKQATDHVQLHALILQKLVLNIVCTDLHERPEFCIVKSQKEF